MKRTLIACLTMMLANPTIAQMQQAGIATDTDAAFQALVDACDDVDALMLRARIRLQLPRTTKEAAATAQEMLRQGFQACADGDAAAGKSQLTKALKIAEEGTSEVFALDKNNATDKLTVDANETIVVDTTSEDTAKRPWWRFW